jgi:putative ABC transport system permease protein
MRIRPTARVAFRALLRNKTRSFLTALGIVIGVAAVIAMVAIGEGAKARVEATFEAMGTNLLIVMSGSTTAGGMRGGSGSMPTLTWDDLRAIQTELRAVRYAAPVLRVNAQVASEEQNWSTSVVGTTLAYFAVRNWRIGSGRMPAEGDVEGSAKVVLLGQTVADKLFGPHANAVGQMVRIRNVPFEVIGVLEAKGQSPMGQDYDDTAILPVSTFRTKIQGGLTKFIAGTIFVGASTADATSRAQQEIEGLLRDRHHLQPGADDDFSVRNLSEIAGAQQEGARVMTTLLAAVAAVALLVGGIGIMNIMLVSVTERTREIGVRMAVGAKPRDILLQFLVEALGLSLAGGLIGVGLGLLSAQQLASRFHWPMLVQPAIVAVSLGFSGLVGIVFGLYPARKASLLDPIEALRFE